MRQQPTSHGFTTTYGFLFTERYTVGERSAAKNSKAISPCHQPKDRQQAPLGTAGVPLLCKRCRSPHIDKQQNQNSYAHASIHQEGTNCTYHLELLRLWRESMKSES